MKPTLRGLEMPERAESQVTLTSSYGSVMVGPGMEKVGVCTICMLYCYINRYHGGTVELN